MSKEYSKALQEIIDDAWDWKYDEKHYIDIISREFDKEEFDNDVKKFKSNCKLVENALQRLEQIDNANPSEALEKLENLGTHGIEYREGFELGFTKSMPFKSTKEFKIIKQALIKAQENEKALNEALKLNGEWAEELDYKDEILSIIKEKNVNVCLLKQVITVIGYNEIMAQTHDKENYKPLLQEEFDLLKEYLG